MALEVAEELLAERVGDLRVDPVVLDVLVAEVIGRVLNAAAGLERMPAMEWRSECTERPWMLAASAYWIIHFFLGPSRPVKRWGPASRRRRR
jgi:hypothetical protein